MKLVYSEEQQLLRDAAKGFLAEKGPVAFLRKMRDSNDPKGFSPEVWREMAEMGWAGIVLPEANGGLDFGHVGAGILCEEMGRTLTPSPFLSTAIISATLLREVGGEKHGALMDAIASGELIVAPALDEGSQHNLATTSLVANSTSSGYLLSGEKLLVPDGHVADKLLVLARTGEESEPSLSGLSLFAVDAAVPGVRIERDALLDSHNWARLTLEDVALSEDALVGEKADIEAPLQRCLDIARVHISAMLLGISAEVFERTLDYLRERKQFGVPIATFQALQHRAAELYNEMELLRSLVLKALQTAESGDEQLPLLACAVKAKACRVARQATNEAVQLHGGMGMTDEFDFGLFMKRAASLRQLYGDSYTMEDRFARLQSY